MEMEKVFDTSGSYYVAKINFDGVIIEMTGQWFNNDGERWSLLVEYNVLGQEHCINQIAFNGNYHASGQNHVYHDLKQLNTVLENRIPLGSSADEGVLKIKGCWEFMQKQRPSITASESYYGS